MSGIVESGTMGGKIRAFIILASKSRKVETDKREMRGFVLVFDCRNAETENNSF